MKKVTKKKPRMSGDSIPFNVPDDKVAQCIKDLIELERYENSFLIDLFGIFNQRRALTEQELAMAQKHGSVINAMVDNFERNYVKG